MELPMSMTAVVGVTRSPLMAMASAPASHSSSTAVRRSRAVTQVVALARVVADRPQRVLELEDDAAPRERDEAGRDARLRAAGR